MAGSLVAAFSTIRCVISHIHPLDVALSLLGLFVFLSIQQRLSLKGPMIWPLLGFIPNLLLYCKELHQWNTRVLAKCSGTYRFCGPLTSSYRGIVTADPTKVEYMLRTRFNNFPKGSFYRERFQELLGDGIFNADGDTWKEQRKIATSEMHTARFMHYSLKAMQGLVHNKLLKLIEDQIKHEAVAVAADDLLPNITSRRSCTSNATAGLVDLQEWLLRFTFDNVCIVALGVDPGCLNPDLPVIPFARAFEEATEYSLLRFLAPPFLWKGMRMLNVGTERKLREAVKIVHEFAENAVKNRKADTSGCNSKNDLLSRLIRIQQEADNDMGSSQQAGEKKSNHFSDEFLRDFCISFILAGRDTSSVALVWFFWLIHENPRVEKKIVEEINDILHRKRRRIILNSGIHHREMSQSIKDVVFEAEELEKMVYLEAALTEAMRLYPPVPIDFKEVQEDDVYPDGMWVKKGDKVFYHTFAMGRLKSIWGEDSEEFKPERWIKDGGGGHLLAANPFKYIVFNAGPRLCVGKKFAYVQMKMVAASILLRFQVKVVEKQVVAPKITTTLYMKNGLLVTFVPRSSYIITS